MERNERDLKGQSVGCSWAWCKSLGDGRSISKLLKMLEPNCAAQLDKFTQFGRMLPSPRNTSKHSASTEARELLQFLNDPSLLKDGTINDKVGQTIQNLYATACLKASTLLFAHFFCRIQFLASNPLPPPTLFAALVPDEAPLYIVAPRKLILIRSSEEKI